MTDRAHSHTATNNRDYAVALGRAFAGATIFSLPLLMTMEMWWLGHYLSPWRLLQFNIANLAMLYGLSRAAGFEETHNRIDDLLDAFAAYAVAALVSLAFLLLLGVIGPLTSLHEAAGKIAIQAVPASFGAMIGARMLGEGEDIEQQEQWRDTYQGQLFLYAAGALFLSFTMAPTEEIILISFQISAWHALVMVLLSILLLHAILYLVQFPGQDSRTAGGREAHRGISLFVRHSIPGYAIAVMVAFFILWTFGRTDGLDVAHVVMAVTVLGFPAAIGAGIARVVV